MIHDDENEVFDRFATVVADGTYCHFLDDFISLIFYQNRVFPKSIKGGEADIKKKEEILADVRLSRRAVKQLIDDLKGGLEMHPIFHLTQNKTDFFTGLVSGNEEEYEKLKDLKLSKEEMDNLKNNVLVDLQETLSKEGQKEYNNAIIKIILDHVDVLHEIIRKDKQKQEMKNDKSESKQMS